MQTESEKKSTKTYYLKIWRYGARELRIEKFDAQSDEKALETCAPLIFASLQSAWSILKSLRLEREEGDKRIPVKPGWELVLEILNRFQKMRAHDRARLVR